MVRAHAGPHKVNTMTVKTVKLQLERAQEEIALLKEKIAILEDQIDKLKILNYIQDKYNIPGN